LEADRTPHSPAPPYRGKKVLRNFVGRVAGSRPRYTLHANLLSPFVRTHRRFDPPLQFVPAFTAQEHNGGSTVGCCNNVGSRFAATSALFDRVESVLRKGQPIRAGGASRGDGARTLPRRVRDGAVNSEGLSKPENRDQNQ